MYRENIFFLFEQKIVCHKSDCFLVCVFLYCLLERNTEKKHQTSQEWERERAEKYKPSNGKMFNFPFWQSFSIINWQQNGKSKAIYIFVYIDILCCVFPLYRFTNKNCVPFNRVVSIFSVWLFSLLHKLALSLSAPISIPFHSAIGCHHALHIREFFPVLHATCECIKIIPHHQQSWKQ